jgi:hypothetical protein
MSKRKRPPSHARRQRRYRARQKAGKRVVEVELDTTETATLYDAGCLDPDKLEDCAAIVVAIHLLIEAVRKALLRDASLTPLPKL